MKKYSFLFYPLFFIFSLLASSWLVLKIEQLHPSDFGRYKSLFESSKDTLDGLKDSVQVERALDAIYKGEK